MFRVEFGLVCVQPLKLLHGLWSTKALYVCMTWHTMVHVVKYCGGHGAYGWEDSAGRLSLLRQLQVKEDRFDSLPDEVNATLDSKGLPVFGALPHSAVLGSIRLDEIQTALGADLRSRLLRRHSRLDVGVDQVKRNGPTSHNSQARLAWHQPQIVVTATASLLSGESRPCVL